MSYPILYQSGETNFNHQGLGVLVDSISAVVSEDLNGKFELDLTYAYNNSLSKFLINGNIIKVDAGNILKEQLFTIVQVSKVIGGKVSVHAEHISYITNDLTLKPKTVVYQQNAQVALNQFVESIKEIDHGITVYSDVQTISSSTWSVPDFKKPRDILGGVDGSILDNWGGEYKFDNRRISLLQQRGSYANTVIAYGRNMTEFEQESNILETVTSIYPVVVKTDKDVETIYTLPELAVDSQYLDRYANRKTLLVDFSDKFDDKNPYSETKLRALANKYIKDNKVGIPKVTLTVSTIDLSKIVTNDYDASRVERLDLADIVKVYFDKLGITTEAKVVGVKWNVLKDAYDEYTLGERKATFGSTIRGSISEVKSVANSAKKNAITALISADSKNTNYYGNSSDGEPTNPKKGDIWFVKDGDKTIIKTWNGTSWVDLVSSDWQEIFNAKLTEDLAKAKVELDAALLEKDKALAGLDEKIADELVVIDNSIAQAQTEATEAKTAAQDAVDKANANAQAIEANTQLITDVNAIANNAKTQAQTAATNAQTAVADAGTAITDAQNALDSYKNMVIGGTNILVTTTDEKIFRGNGAENQWAILSLLTKSSLADYNLKVGDKVSFSATCEISGSGFSGIFTPRLRTAWTNLTSNYGTYTITKAEKIYFKSTFVVTESRLANGTGVDFRADNVPSTVSMKWSEIQLEIGDKTTGYAPSPEEISVEITNINGQLSQKVSQTSFDTLNGTVTSQATQISQNKTDIASKANQTTVNTLTGRVSTAETNINQNAQEIVLKANKTAVDSLTGRVSTSEGSITTMAGQIALKASKTDVDTVKGRVSTAEGSITTMAGQIALKANQTDVNTIGGKVSSLESSFTVQSGQITALNTKTDGQTTKIGSLQSSYDGLTSTVASVVTGSTNETLISTQMISGTTLKHPNYPDMPMVQVPVTNGESYTVSSNIPNSGTATVPIAHVWYLQTPSIAPNSAINGVYDGKSITLPALSDKIYIVFRTQSIADRFVSGEYWLKVTKTLASQSQITQLSSDINLRVTKNSVVNQINISPESILIAGNKVQITGQTYIENGVIENAKIKDLSASKLTAGTIDASLINVTKINASNVTTGILSADRIAANSITAAHISISSLSALSANLGVITAGTINAATVNIININAANITSGTLNAARIGANSITSDKIKATSLELFSDDTHLRIMSNGIRFQSKAQLRFGPWIQIDGKPTSTEGLYLGGWGNASDVKHIAFTRSDGSTFMMRAEDGMDYGTNNNISINDLNIFDSTHFWKGVRVHGNLLTDGYIVMGGSVQEASIQYDRGNKTMSFRIPGGYSNGSSYWFNNKITSADGFASSSLLSLKNIKGAYEGNALEDICQTEIMEYQYKNNPNDRQLSPIIDDVNKIKKYHLPDVITDGKSVNLYAMGSLSWLAIKQIAQKLEKIEEKLNAFT